MMTLLTIKYIQVFLVLWIIGRPTVRFEVSVTGLTIHRKRVGMLVAD